MDYFYIWIIFSYFLKLHFLEKNTKRKLEWRPFVYVAIDHQPFTALEQWKASRHWLLRTSAIGRSFDERIRVMGRPDQLISREKSIVLRTTIGPSQRCNNTAISLSSWYTHGNWFCPLIIFSNWHVTTFLH